MREPELRKVIDESSRRLLQVSDPPVRCWLLSDVLGKSVEDLIFQRALEECESYPPKVKLLKAMKWDGTWPVIKKWRRRETLGIGPHMNWTLTTMLVNLYKLLQYRAGWDDGRISASIRTILSLQSKDGHIVGPWTTSFPLPYWNGFVLHDLLRLGMEKDRRVKRLAGWLLSIQRKDGGWNIPYMQDVKYLPEYRKMGIETFVVLMGTEEKERHDPKDLQRTPSCVWSTVLVAWGLTQSQELRGSAATRRAAVFVLDRFFRRNPHPSFFMSPKNWTKFRYPPNYGGGLTALDVLTSAGLGPENPKMERPIRWLVDSRGEDGLWHLTQGPSAATDQWVTLSALQVLSRYADRM